MGSVRLRDCFREAVPSLRMTIKKRLASGGPNLIANHGDHEQEIEPKGPQDSQFGAFEVAAGNGMFLGARQLIGLERG